MAWNTFSGINVRLEQSVVNIIGVVDVCSTLTLNVVCVLGPFSVDYTGIAKKNVIYRLYDLAKAWSAQRGQKEQSLEMLRAFQVTKVIWDLRNFGCLKSRTKAKSSVRDRK